MPLGRIALALAISGLLAAGAPAAAAAEPEGPLPGVDCAAAPCGAVLPAAEWFEPLAGSPPVHVGYRRGPLGLRRSAGFVVLSTDATRVRGFGGPIPLLVGVSAGGTITGVRILAQHETIFEQILSPSLMDQFVAQFPGHPAGTDFDLQYTQSAVRVDAITQATITSQALLDSVERSAALVRAVYVDGEGAALAAPPWWRELLRGPALRRLAISLGGLATGVASLALRRYRLLYAAVTMLAVGFVLGRPLSIFHFLHLVQGRWEAVTGDGVVLLLMAAAVLGAPLAGRWFCGRLCPFGAVQELVYRLVPWQWQVPAPWHRRLVWVKYGLLGVIAGTALAGATPAVAWLEPFGYLFVSIPGIAAGVYLALLLAGGAVIERFYCRYLCPLGALLGLLSVRPLFPIARAAQCTRCRVCPRACPVDAIDAGGRVQPLECIRCDACELNYANQSLCPRFAAGRMEARRRAARVGQHGPVEQPDATAVP